MKKYKSYNNGRHRVDIYTDSIHAIGIEFNTNNAHCESNIWFDSIKELNITLSTLTKNINKITDFKLRHNLYTCISKKLYVNKEKLILNKTIEDLREYVRKGNTHLAVTKEYYFDNEMFQIKEMLTPTIKHYDFSTGETMEKIYQYKTYPLNRSYLIPTDYYRNENFIKEFFIKNKELIIKFIKYYDINLIYNMHIFVYNIFKDINCAEVLINGVSLDKE
jgi:hypothetical protein